MKYTLTIADMNDEEFIRVFKQLNQPVDGEIVIKQGDVGENFYLMESGEAAVFQEDDERPCRKPSYRSRRAHRLPRLDERRDQGARPGETRRLHGQDRLP